MAHHTQKQSTRTDQQLSIQPPEIRHFSTVRHRCATILPAACDPASTSKSLESHKAHQLSEFAEPSTSALFRSTVDLSPRANLSSFDLAPSEAVDLVSTSHQLPQTINRAQSISNSREPQAARAYIHTPPLSAVSDCPGYDTRLTSDPVATHATLISLQDMSTSGYMMAPSQYGMHQYSSPNSYAPNYPPASQQGYAENRSSSSGPYDATYAGSSITAHEQRRHEDQSALPPYGSQHQSLSRSPYQQQQAMGAMRSSSVPSVSSGHSYGYSAPHPGVTNQSLGSNAATFPPPPLYPPTSYGVSDYQPLPTMYPPSSTTPAAYPSYEASSGLNQPSANQISPLSSSPGTQSNAVMPRVLNSRPKPQCWEHGCNGRQFSTFSNLLRHQREKSGTASKSYCPRCGAEFTRTTARNGHMAHDKCKPRRPSDTDR